VNAAPSGASAALVLADGTVFYGHGAGASGVVVGELCFNTAMTGHQEILADPSYAGQIVCFTFPHVGNVGANAEDEESASAPGRKAAVGMVARAPITAPASWRAEQGFDEWLASRAIAAITGVDTRAITRRIRETGMPMAALQHARDSKFDIDALKALAAGAPSMEAASSPAPSPILKTPTGMRAAGTGLRGLPPDRKTARWSWCSITG